MGFADFLRKSTKSPAEIKQDHLQKLKWQLDGTLAEFEMECRKAANSGARKVHFVSNARFGGSGKNIPTGTLTISDGKQLCKMVEQRLESENFSRFHVKLVCPRENNPYKYHRISIDAHW